MHTLLIGSSKKVQLSLKKWRACVLASRKKIWITAKTLLCFSPAPSALTRMIRACNKLV